MADSSKAFGTVVMEVRTKIKLKALIQAGIMTNIQTVVDESTPQFISGVRSLDEYDAYLQTLKDFHVDRAVEIVQQAYDDFISR